MARQPHHRTPLLTRKRTQVATGELDSHYGNVQTWRTVNFTKDGAALTSLLPDGSHARAGRRRPPPPGCGRTRRHRPCAC